MSDLSKKRIPLPQIILKGDWYGIVYAMCSESETVEEHNIAVDHAVSELRHDYDTKNHWSVSLREVKRELVFCDDRVKSYCTLVQFRVRDIF